MAKRKRDIQLKFRVTPQEREMIETKMAQFGTTNMAAYLRKMAIDGSLQRNHGDAVFALAVNAQPEGFHILIPP